MPIFRTALICLCIFLSAAFLRGVKSAEWLDSILIQSPLRLHDLSGDLIVQISQTRTSHPLLFPKSVTIFERLDGSLNQLYTLEELVSNPGLVPKNKFHSTKVPARQNSISPISQPINLAEREKKLFDTSLLLVPQNSNPLPSDDQLKAFLEEGRQRYTPPVDPKEIIDNLLKDEYADHPVVSLLNDSPEVKRVLKSESFQLSKNSLFSSANVALQAVSSSSNPNAFTGSLPEPPSAPVFSDVTADHASTGLTSLKLQARKPSRDGTLRPAQASEIYLTTQDLKELLKDMTKDPAIAGEVRSVTVANRASPYRIIGVKQPDEWHPDGMSRVYIEAASGYMDIRFDAVTLPAVERAWHAAYPLHTGKLESLPYKLFLTLSGMLVATLASLGLLCFVRGRLAGRR